MRIKRDHEERSKHIFEQKEIERRRNLTEEERQAENELLGTDENQRKK